LSLLRQNTDYALRVMVHLAHNETNDSCISARTLAKEQDISYQFACKILQQLHEAKLVESTMGPKGGYRLSRPAEEITMRDVIEAVQGPVDLNRCLKGLDTCPRQPICPVTEKLAVLQGQIEDYLEQITLAQLNATGRPGREIKKAESDQSMDKTDVKVCTHD
jgi:Rrf2 family iron-sulfur cluster assembly transcriptional regulator